MNDNPQDRDAEARSQSEGEGLGEGGAGGVKGNKQLRSQSFPDRLKAVCGCEIQF